MSNNKALMASTLIEDPTRWALTVDGETVFQVVDQWGLPYAGSPASSLHDDLCEILKEMGHLDADALNTL